MKTFYSTISLMSLVILMGCQTPQSREIEVSILFDITSSVENSKMDIATEDVLDFFDLQNNPFNHGKLSVSTLTDAHFSEIVQVKLPPVVSMNNYNKYLRENEVNLFMETVDSILNDFKQIEKGKQASSLFIPLSRELNRLARSRADSKIMYCATDLYEHSSVMFSSYSKTEFRKLLNNPDKLTTLLSQKAPLSKNLNGIKVYLIYTPSMATNDGFLAISQWYKELLESKGAEVYIGANLILD